MDAWKGFALAFNRREWFRAHEVLEGHWMHDRTSDREFFQGMIQAAVALHHHASGNREGARGVARSARRRLSGYLPVHRGVDLQAVLRAVERAIECGGPPPTLPYRLEGPEE